MTPRVSRERLVVIGGDAAGMSAAAQARRLRKADDLEIVVLEQGPDVSYSACGIPYWVGGPGARPGPADRPHDRRVRAQDITVHTGTRAEEIDLDGGHGQRLPAAERFGYDSLVVATGGRPTRPGIPGLDADGVYGVHRLADGADIRAAIAAGAKRAVVLGGGYIGLEMAEVLQTPRARGDRRPGRSGAHGPARHRHGRAASARPWARWASTCRPTSRCARSRWTPTASSARCAPTRAAIRPTSSSSGWAWARR